MVAPSGSSSSEAADRAPGKFGLSGNSAALNVFRLNIVTQRVRLCVKAPDIDWGPQRFADWDLQESLVVGEIVGTLILQAGLDEPNQNIALDVDDEHDSWLSVELPINPIQVP